MNTALVGYTGFVGSNLSESYEFSKKYNSKNIEEAFGTAPDLLVYAGIRAEKFLANKNPESDMEMIENAIDNIKKINAKRMVLISTIDVYKHACKVDENTKIDTADLLPYGANRYYLENKVREYYPHALIVRLPGLYGKNIKKNFIYDYIHLVPSMLSENKFGELSCEIELLKKFYVKRDNGFYECAAYSREDKNILKEIFKNAQFSALNFTDSRGMFQFYPLSRLWQDIQIALRNEVYLLNLATEPIRIDELYQYLKGNVFDNYLDKEIPNYDFRTVHYNLYSGSDGYIYGKNYIMKDIKNFIEEEQCL